MSESMSESTGLSLVRLVQVLKEWSHECTHLVQEEIVMTEKAMLALVRADQQQQRHHMLPPCLMLALRHPGLKLNRPP